MTTSKSVLVTIRLLLLLLVAGSGKDKNVVIDDEPVVLCDHVCTYIALKISNQHGVLFLLDDYYTINASTGDKISFKTFAGDSRQKANVI